MLWSSVPTLASPAHTPLPTPPHPTPPLSCHWQDSIAEWIATYRTAVTALWSVLPGAAVGPGNFCNFLFGGCASNAYSIVTAIMDAACAFGPVDAVGEHHDHPRNGSAGLDRSRQKRGSVNIEVCASVLADTIPPLGAQDGVCMARVQRATT